MFQASKPQDREVCAKQHQALATWFPTIESHSGHHTTQNPRKKIYKCVVMGWINLFVRSVLICKLVYNKEPLSGQWVLTHMQPPWNNTCKAPSIGLARGGTQIPAKKRQEEIRHGLNIHNWKLALSIWQRLCICKTCVGDIYLLPWLGIYSLPQFFKATGWFFCKNLQMPLTLIIIAPWFCCCC